LRWILEAALRKGVAFLEVESLIYHDINSSDFPNLREIHQSAISRVPDFKLFNQKSPSDERLLTNQLQFAADTIGAIYRERWQIELFFKALKQNLKIKTFVGTSANAVRFQIWTALIAILLLKSLQFKSTFGWALSNLVALLRWNLFSYRDLWEGINRPFDTPPESQAIQRAFRLGQHLAQPNLTKGAYS
jgi:IS4 transposase